MKKLKKEKSRKKEKPLKKSKWFTSGKKGIRLAVQKSDMYNECESVDAEGTDGWKIMDYEDISDNPKERKRARKSSIAH